VKRYTPVKPQAPVAPLVNAIQDGGFEATNPSTFVNPYWQQGSTQFGTVICDTSCALGSQHPRTGSFWVWFGGASAGDVGYISQTVILTPGVASLNFYLWMEANSNPGNFMKASIDGTPIFTATTADQASYPDYTLVSINVTAFATGGAHIVRFDSTTLGSGNFHVDDVALDISGPACQPDSLPWVSASPVTGTVAAGGSNLVTLTFDPIGQSVGLHTGQLCLTSNDPLNPTVQIPVALNVKPTLFLPILRK
jgi:hypothetical protein